MKNRNRARTSSCVVALCKGHGASCMLPHPQNATIVEQNGSHTSCLPVSVFLLSSTRIYWNGTKTNVKAIKQETRFVQKDHVLTNSFSKPAT